MPYTVTKFVSSIRKIHFRNFLVLFLLCNHLNLFSQVLTLEHAIQLAREQSPYYHRSKNGYEKSYWKYQNFKAAFKPHVRLSASFPTFYRSINPITQPDGSIEFRRVSQANNLLGINVVQNVGALGGTFQIGSSLQRTDNFLAGQSSYFLSNPFQLAYRQESLLYNAFKWQKKLEPLLFDIAEKEYDKSIELGILETVDYYLQGVEAETALKIAEKNKALADTLYQTASERFKNGTLPLSDLLQLELNVLKSENEMKERTVIKTAALLHLKRILGLKSDELPVLVAPGAPTEFMVNLEVAMEHARANRPEILQYKAERLKAEQELAEARGKNSLTFNVNANLGTQQTARRFLNSYSNLQNHQYIGVSLDVPIKDWGYRKSQIRLADANKELVEVNMQQDELSFEQEIQLQVLRFNQRYSQYKIALKTTEVANERLSITTDRYLLGKVAMADLNLALQENVNANLEYVRALNDYWLSFYTLRSLTLYDFITDKPLKVKK